MKDKKIILGMSGGVDSSVCAYLLKKQGYHVIGLFMQNWDTYINNDVLGHIKNEDKQCSVSKDYTDVEKVGKELGIEVHKINFIKNYWDNVFKPTIEDYKSGITPNPDVLCNKYIKFGSFLDYAKKNFKCSNIAMGHYAKTKTINGVKYLMLSIDENKDQTYFLCNINQKQLNSCIFPLGNLKKEEVRIIAKEAGLDNYNKIESTGICFIGERNFKDFLKNYIKPKTGKVVDITTKKTIGRHDGIMFYTIGQNKKLNLGGKTAKYYVCDKDTKKNILFVVDEKNKTKFLSSNSATIRDFNFINGKKMYDKIKNKEIYLRFRHRQKLVKGKISYDKKVFIIYYTPTIGVTPGQYAVVYYKNICIGGGPVEKTVFI